MGTTTTPTTTSQPEPADDPPPELEATVEQGARDVRPMPCTAVPTAASAAEAAYLEWALVDAEHKKEKDRFAALDELLGAKPVLEFGGLLSVFHERNPIAGLHT